MTEWAVLLELEVIGDGVEGVHRVKLTQEDPVYLKLDDGRTVRIRLAPPTRPEIPTPPPPNPDPALTTYPENSR